MLPKVKTVMNVNWTCLLFVMAKCAEWKIEQEYGYGLTMKYEHMMMRGVNRTMLIRSTFVVVSVNVHCLSIRIYIGFCVNEFE